MSLNGRHIRHARGTYIPIFPFLSANVDRLGRVQPSPSVELLPAKPGLHTQMCSSPSSWHTELGPHGESVSHLCRVVVVASMVLSAPVDISAVVLSRVVLGAPAATAMAARTARAEVRGAMSKGGTACLFVCLHRFWFVGSLSPNTQPANRVPSSAPLSRLVA